MAVSKKSVLWTSTCVTTVLQENGRRHEVTFLAQTFWTHPHFHIVSFFGHSHLDVFTQSMFQLAVGSSEARLTSVAFEGFVTVARICYVKEKK